MTFAFLSSLSILVAYRAYRAGRGQTFSLLREVVVVMMVAWILNLSMSGKAPRHHVHILAALRQRLAHFWVTMCDELLTWKKLLIEYSHGKDIVDIWSCFLQGSRALPKRESWILKSYLLTGLIGLSNQTESLPHGRTSVVRQHTLWAVHIRMFLSGKWTGFSSILQCLERQKKRRLRGFVNHTLEILHTRTWNLTHTHTHTHIHLP